MCRIIVLTFIGFIGFYPRFTEDGLCMSLYGILVILKSVNITFNVLYTYVRHYSVQKKRKFRTQIFLHPYTCNFS